jgi:2-hydroxychromene-2-carboxylate isomerase
MRTLDFWFDYTCPYAYLGSTSVEAVAHRTHRTLTWKPMLLGGVFKAHNTPQRLFETLSAPKIRHNSEDLSRQAERYGVDLHMPTEHPMRSVEALRATLATHCDPSVIHGFFKAYWVQGLPIHTLDVIRSVLARAGYSPDEILARIDHDDVKQDLRARTDEAIALGIFGAPSYVVDGSDLYWGQDRTDLFDVVRNPHPIATPTGRVLEIFWDFSSPYAYLGATQAAALAQRTGATLVWRPMLLGGLFRAVGQVDVPLATYPEPKQRHTSNDLERWARHYNVAFRFPSRFPMNTVKALRAYMCLPEAQRDAFRAKVLHAFWVDNQDISDNAVLLQLLGDNGAEILALTQTSSVKESLIAATQHAAQRGVFGAPTWIVDGTELFWGQDRIPLVERHLLK